MMTRFEIMFFSIFFGFCSLMAVYYIYMKILCFKHKGKCINCHCWSCPREKYIEDEGEEKK